MDAKKSNIFEILNGYKFFNSSTKLLYEHLDIVIQKPRLRISFDEIYDPKGLCKDVTNVGRWGNSDVELFFESLSNIDDIMFIIEQSYNRQI